MGGPGWGIFHRGTSPSETETEQQHATEVVLQPGADLARRKPSKSSASSRGSNGRTSCTSNDDEKEADQHNATEVASPSMMSPEVSPLGAEAVARKMSCQSRKRSKNSASTVSTDEHVDLRDPKQVGAAVLGSTWFDVAIGFVILANCATIGIEQSLRLNDLDTGVVDKVEHAFLTVYILELVLRFYVLGQGCLRDGWVRFDCFLVLLGIATGWILEPVLGGAQQLGPLMVLRTTKLLRLARMVRFLIRFRELWMLVRGLMNCMTTMCHTLTLMTIILYIFGCVCIETVTLSYKGVEDTLGEELSSVIADHFRSLPIAMLTLVQFVCFDNVVYIYKPLVEANPMFAFLFMGIILVVGIVLMNLVTAVIVNSALEQAMQDKDLMRSLEESRRKKMFKQLRGVFLRLDEDGSGELSRHEIQDMSEEDRALLVHLTKIQDPVEMFDCLDVDGNGDLTIEEFVCGVQQIAFSHTSIEMKRMERHIESMHKMMRESHQVQDGLVRSMHLVLDELHGQSPEPQNGSLRENASMYSKKSKWGDNGAFSLGEWAPSEAGEAHPDAREEENACKTMPLWAAELVQEVRQACTSGIKSAMEESCPSLVARAVADVAVTVRPVPRPGADASAEKPGTSGIESILEAACASRVARPVARPEADAAWAEKPAPKTAIPKTAIAAAGKGGQNPLPAAAAAGGAAPAAAETQPNAREEEPAHWACHAAAPWMQEVRPRACRPRPSLVAQTARAAAPRVRSPPLGGEARPPLAAQAAASVAAAARPAARPGPKPAAAPTAPAAAATGDFAPAAAGAPPLVVAALRPPKAVQPP